MTTMQQLHVYEWIVIVSVCVTVVWLGLFHGVRNNPVYGPKWKALLVRLFGVAAATAATLFIILSYHNVGICRWTLLATSVIPPIWFFASISI